MPIKEQIQEHIKDAMRSRNQQKLTILRSLMAAIKQVEIDSRISLDDSEVQNILQKELKKRREALDFAVKAERADLIEANKDEIVILTSYLGEQFSADKLRELIVQLSDSGLNTIGQVMGQLNKDHKGKFDGKLASEIAKDILK